MGDDNVQNMSQLPHEAPCPACGSALAVDERGALALAAPCGTADSTAGEPPRASALDAAWDWFVASDAPLDD